MLPKIKALILYQKNTQISQAVKVEALQREDKCLNSDYSVISREINDNQLLKDMKGEIGVSKR